MSGQVDHRHLHLHHISGATNPRLAGVNDDQLLALIESKRRALAAPDADEPPAVEVLPPERDGGET